MTLRNLLNTGQLAEHKTDAVHVRRMLVAAQRSIDDAKNETISLCLQLESFVFVLTISTPMGYHNYGIY